MAKLSDIMVSRVRGKVLKILLANPNEMYYVRELTRKTKEEINAIRRELARLQERGLVKSEQRGNRLYYQFRKAYPFFNELLGLVVKTTGLGKVIIKNRNKLGFLKYAFINTRFIRNEKKTPNQVDLVLIGKVIMPQIDLLIKEYEKKHQIEVPYSCLEENEFNYRLNRKDPFITTILSQPRIMLLGDEILMMN